jgi:hypothetical protein
MLDQFQKAFADLIASTDFVIQVREKPDSLRSLYDLSDLEWRRLVSVVNQPGMECNCMLYRANRLTPIAMYLPDLCKALGEDRLPLLSEYWARHTHTSINFLSDSHRFCEFVEEKIADGYPVADTVPPVLEREKALLTEQLAEIYPERYSPGSRFCDEELEGRISSGSPARFH